VRAAHPAPTTTPEDLALEVEALGLASGLEAVGIASAEPLLRARAALEERKAAGLHAGMDFTYRNPTRSTAP
jgi:epoxyqueuosine reductase